MKIRKPKPGQLPEREVSSEPIYHARRRFLQAAGIGVSGLASRLGAVFTAGTTPRSAELRSLTAQRNPKFKVEGRQISPEAITAGYNNYYEFLPASAGVPGLPVGFTYARGKLKTAGRGQNRLSSTEIVFLTRLRL